MGIYTQEQFKKLEERCEAYKGQVKAGALELERLHAEVARLRAERDDYRDCIKTTDIIYKVNIEQLHTILKECADSLETLLMSHDYSYRSDLKIKHARNMEPVRKARELLNGNGD